MPTFFSKLVSNLALVWLLRENTLPGFNPLTLAVSAYPRP
jgi:hypothetical protein